MFRQKDMGKSNRYRVTKEMKDVAAYVTQTQSKG